jgi:hypothetical protein
MVGAANEPLNAPVPLPVETVATVVQGAEPVALYCRRTGSPLGTAVPEETDPENATAVWPGGKGEEIIFKAVDVL